MFEPVSPSQYLARVQGLLEPLASGSLDQVEILFDELEQQRRKATLALPVQAAQRASESFWQAALCYVVLDFEAGDSHRRQALEILETARGPALPESSTVWPGWPDGGWKG